MPSRRCWKRQSRRGGHRELGGQAPSSGALGLGRLRACTPQGSAPRHGAGIGAGLGLLAHEVGQQRGASHQQGGHGGQRPCVSGGPRLGRRERRLSGPRSGQPKISSPPDLGLGLGVTRRPHPDPALAGERRLHLVGQEQLRSQVGLPRFDQHRDRPRTGTGRPRRPGGGSRCPPTRAGRRGPWLARRPERYASGPSASLGSYSASPSVPASRVGSEAPRSTPGCRSCARWRWQDPSIRHGILPI